jgi:hypothetical protein
MTKIEPTTMSHATLKPKVATLAGEDERDVP